MTTNRPTPAALDTPAPRLQKKAWLGQCFIACAFLVLAGAAVAVVSAQDTADPADTSDTQPDTRPDARTIPALTDRSLDERMLERVTRPVNTQTLAPTTTPGTFQVVPNQPTNPQITTLADGTQLWSNAQTLLTEGTFLSGRVGQIVRLQTGGLAFVPAIESGKSAQPALALLPCATYRRLESLLAGLDDGLWMSLTGEVFEYKGRNFVLPTSFASMPVPTNTPDDDESLTTQDTQPTQTENNQPENEPEPDQAAEAGIGDPRIDELVTQLKAQRDQPRGLDTTFREIQRPKKAKTANPASRTSPTGPTSSTGPRIEGDMILSQKGRMVRTPTGSWVISIDNDTDQTNATGPTQLLLLPCKTVEAMEFQAERLGDSWTFQISGNLYQMGEHTYLVPRLFVTLPGSDIEALQ